MGKKPITINEPNPVNSENQELKFEENEDERVIEFDDIDENYQETEEIEQKVVDNQPKRIESSDIKKVLVVYSDNTFEILTPRYNN